MIAVTEWEKISRYAAPGLTDGTLKKIDAAKLEEAREHYLSKYDLKNFQRYSGKVDNINRLVRKVQGKVVSVEKI